MKNLKKLVALLLVVVLSVFCLAACGGGGDSEAGGVKVYSVEAKFNSETVNQWKNIYLVDDNTYIITVDAVDSQDATRVTADFVMKGNYTLDGNTLTLEPGYGSAFAMNGDTPVIMQVTPDNGAMYFAMMGTQGYTFTLNEDGTFDVAG